MDVAEVDHFTSYCDLCPTNNIDMHCAPCRPPSAASSSVTFVDSSVHPSLLCSCGRLPQITMSKFRILSPCLALITQHACMFVLRKSDFIISVCLQKNCNIQKQPTVGSFGVVDNGISRCYFLPRPSSETLRSYPCRPRSSFHRLQSALMMDRAFGNYLAFRLEPAVGVFL